LYFSDMGFCGFGLPTEDGPHKRGARHPRPSLYIYEKLLRHVCLPHCFQRFVINA
jgi:hypothetical protein